MSNPVPPFVQEDVVVESNEVNFQGFFQLKTLRLRHRLFSGEWSQLLQRELFERGEAVAVLLYDPIKDSVVLTEQFRVGALQDERSPWLIELVAGCVEPGEIPVEVAARETREEAGTDYQHLIPICRYWVSPGGTSERMHVYCGLVDSQGVGGVHGLAHEGEDIRLMTLSLDRALELLEAGVINNAATIIALQWLQIHRSRLSLTHS